MKELQRSRSRLLLGVLGAGLGLCLILFGLGIVLPRILDPVSRSTNCGRVASAFAEALRTGDARLARSLAVSDAGIVEWMSVRQGFSCPFSLDLDAYESGLVCGHSDNAPDEWNCGHQYICWLGGWYLFRLETIELEQKVEGCRVTYWSEPCEAFGNEILDEKCQ